MVPDSARVRYSLHPSIWLILLGSSRVSCFLVAVSSLCQDHKMKHFLLTFLLPMTLAAQNMQQLTEQLGKTVLYGDIALSPDGALVAWVQSAAAMTLKE